MSRTLPIVAVILGVAALGALLFLSLGGDRETLVPVEKPGPGDKATREPVGPAGDSSKPTAPTPRRSAAKATRAGAPTPPPRCVLRVGWLGTRPPEYRPQDHEAPLEPPPFERVLKPASKPVVRTIRVTGQRPLFMLVHAGTPFGGKKITPETDGDTVAFRLEDPIGGRGPRRLRFALDEAGDAFVERFLPSGTGARTFRIGEPGTITGRITDAAGKPIPGTVAADGMRARADFNGDFSLAGIRAGQAVVIARAAAPGSIVKRCLLRSPGGPYTIRLDAGVDLKVQLNRFPDDTAEATLVPGIGSTVPDDYAAEEHYCELVESGAEGTLSGLPPDFAGVLAFIHDRLAAQLVRLAPPLTDVVRVTLTPRTVISGEVRDAETLKPMEGEIRVTTSADETTLYDLAVARRLVPRPTVAWRQPIPDLHFLRLVDIDREPESDKAFEIHADPALRRIGVRVEAEGYLPFAKNAIKVDGGPVHLVFHLRRDRPIAGATVVLALPPAPAGGWGGLELEGTFRGNAEIDRRRGEVRFTGLMPGLYHFKLEGGPEVKPRQVQVEAGANLRLDFPD